MWREMGEYDAKEAKCREVMRSSYAECCCWVNLNKIFKCPLFLATWRGGGGFFCMESRWHGLKNERR